mgnify:CR=1 FL=1
MEDYIGARVDYEPKYKDVLTYFQNIGNLYTWEADPWYETCKFPALVWDEDNILLVIRTRGEYTASYLNECKPLTNDEIEGLKQ